MAAVLDDLAAHCARGVLEPFRFGVLDCSLWAADWVLLRTGRDVAAGWRGRYSTRLGYLRRLHHAGGLETVASAALASIGGHPVACGEPCPGDIGLIATRDGPALAVRLDTRWAAKTCDGLWFTPVAIKFWRFLA